MDTARINRYAAAVTLAILLCSCVVKPDESIPVVSIFKVVPESGLTTTRFEFDASQTIPAIDENNPILIRYDWQSDGIWDEDYNTNNKIVHKFRKPGQYKVTMEARNLLGVRDTSFATIIVQQGFSAPYPDLVILPDSGNIYTNFSFDASKSFDEEDSVNTLKFRWDFDGDGVWDTEFLPGSMIRHQYPGEGIFQAGVEVQDPTLRSTVLRKKVLANLLNDSIQPQFTIDGGFKTVVDVFHFDASGSEYLGRTDKVLTYSWDILNDGIWEAENLTTPFFNRLIRTVGTVKVKLRVTDDRGLYMETVNKTEVFAENTPPKAALVICNPHGNLQTNFVFHSFGTSDRETSIMDLDYQWDVDGDGIWETEFHNMRQISCKYQKTGKYLVTLKVTDSHEDFALVKDSVFVFNGNHKTDLLIDKADNYLFDYYGTVKIGNLWWMQENLMLEIEPSKESSGVVPLMYKGDRSWFRRYGGLYKYDLARSICPKGWRLPTKDEFQEMLNLESIGSLAPLLLGGSSELHVLLGGYIDSQGRSIGLATATHFWLADRNGYGSPYAWYIDKAKSESRAVITSQTNAYSIRCVKSD